MLGGLVGHRRDDDHVAPVRGVDRLLRLRRVADRAERLLDHVGARVEREQHAGREAPAVGDERVADAHGHESAVGARADIAGAVRGRGRVSGFTGAVAVVDGVERVVVAEEEVPTRDVVDVTVVVVVDLVVVGRVEDEILGVGEPVAVAVGSPAKSAMSNRPSPLQSPSVAAHAGRASPMLMYAWRARSAIAPASRHLMPESRTAIKTSPRPWVTPSARSSAGPFWPHWLCGDENSSGRGSRRLVTLYESRSSSVGSTPAAGSSAGP